MAEKAARPALIFDYDGTIHDTMRIYRPAVRRAFQWLREQGHTVPETSDRQIASWLGMNTRDMWNSFLPGLPEKVKQKAAVLVGDAMKAALRKGCGAWYPGIRETLDALKRKGYRMAVLSNCQASYGAAHWQAFHMEQWFEYFFDCESFQSAPKSEIIRKLGDLYPPPYIVIGDRYSDLEAAKGSGSPFIGCLYGFGSEAELCQADFLAAGPEEIQKYL